MSTVNLSGKSVIIVGESHLAPEAPNLQDLLQTPAMQHSDASQSLQLQARRDIAIDRFVRNRGLVCKGDIEALMTQEAQSLVQRGLFPTEDEAGLAILHAYKRYVRGEEQSKIRKAIAILQRPEYAEALVEERLQREIKKAEEPVWNARQKWLGVHKELQARFGIDGALPEWRKTAKFILRDLGHNDYYNLQELLKEEQTALEELHAAERQRDERMGEARKSVEVQVAQDLKKFEMFLRACRGDFKRQIFVQNRVKAMQERFKALDKAQCEISPPVGVFSTSPYKYDGTLGNIEAALVGAKKGKDALEKGLLDFFGPEVGPIIIRCAIVPNEMNRQIAERLCAAHQRPDVARETYLHYVRAVEMVNMIEPEFSRLEQELELIKLEKQDIKEVLGASPCASPVTSTIEQQAATLEKHVDLEDEAAVQELLKQAQVELLTARIRRVDVSYRLRDLAIASAMMQVAESEFLESILDREPTKEDAEVHAALLKRQEEANQEKQKFLCEFVSLDALIAKNERILAQGPHANPAYKTVDHLNYNLRKIKNAQAVVKKLKTPGSGALTEWEMLSLQGCWEVVQRTAILQGYQGEHLGSCFLDIQQGDDRELLECFDFHLQVEADVLQQQIDALSGDNIDESQTKTLTRT